MNLVVEAYCKLFFLFVGCGCAYFVIYWLLDCYEKEGKWENEKIEITTRFQSFYIVIAVILQVRFYHFVLLFVLKVVWKSIMGLYKYLCFVLFLVIIRISLLL